MLQGEEIGFRGWRVWVHVYMKPRGHIGTHAPHHAICNLHSTTPPCSPILYLPNLLLACTWGWAYSRYWKRCSRKSVQVQVQVSPRTG